MDIASKIDKFLEESTLGSGVSSSIEDGAREILRQLKYIINLAEKSKRFSLEKGEIDSQIRVLKKSAKMIVDTSKELGGVVERIFDE